MSDSVKNTPDDDMRSVRDNLDDTEMIIKSSGRVVKLPTFAFPDGKEVQLVRRDIVTTTRMARSIGSTMALSLPLALVSGYLLRAKLRRGLFSSLLLGSTIGLAVPLLYTARTFESRVIKPLCDLPPSEQTEFTRELCKMRRVSAQKREY